jgi:hypothetical protein
MSELNGIPPAGPGFYSVEAKYADLLRSVGLIDAQSVFDNPNIRVWRSITERENCVLDHPGGRLHIKRNKPGQTGIETEIEGIRLLEKAGIGTVPVCGYGRLHDGRGFLITDHLVGFEDCHKQLISGEIDFDRLLEPTAELAARLHAAKLHHRDLYLGHFFGDSNTEPPALRLIDAGRVRTLPRLLAKRWVIKDLAQFIFSTQGLPISDAQRTAWLDCYARHRGITLRFRSLIDAKARQIARHDAQLRRKNPTRNVALDG